MYSDFDMPLRKSIDCIFTRLDKQEAIQVLSKKFVKHVTGVMPFSHKNCPAVIIHVVFLFRAFQDPIRFLRLSLSGLLARFL